MVSQAQLKRIRKDVQENTSLKCTVDVAYGHVNIRFDSYELTPKNLIDLYYYMENHLDVLLHTPKLQVINDGVQLSLGIRLPMMVIDKKF